MAFDLDDEELKATRRMNGSDKNVGSIEKLIEELTKVRPDELSKDGLKLFNKINEIIDINKELEENNTYLKTHILTPTTVKLNYIPKTLVEEKIEELKEEGNYKTLENPDGRVHFQAEPCDYKIQVLEELLGKGK